jgi:RecB family exonuclease
MDAPTGLEPTTPVTLRETSVTERQDFRSCRRKWFLGTVHRLTPAGGALHFWFGNLIHAALESYYLVLPEGGPTQAEKAALSKYHAFYRQSVLEAHKDLGALFDSISEEYADMREMGVGMLEGYFRMQREQGGFHKIVLVEQRYGTRIPGTVGRLTGRFDLIIQMPNAEIMVVDHKTAASKHNSAHLDLDDQLTGYCYVYWRATGTQPRGAIYNVLLKKVAKKPTLLKSGKLSQDKAQATTYPLYLEAIREHRLNVSDYSDMLLYLKDKGWGDFYMQETVYRSKAQLLAFEKNLVIEWRDMRRVARHPEEAYPNPTAMNCPGCPVRMICATMQDGGDYQSIIENEYLIAPPRR